MQDQNIKSAVINELLRIGCFLIYYLLLIALGVIIVIGSFWGSYHLIIDVLPEVGSGRVIILIIMSIIGMCLLAIMLGIYLIKPLFAFKKNNSTMKVTRKYTLVFVVIVLLICCIPPLIVPIFQLCCGIMMTLGNLVGLSYKEVCVLGNVYMQGGLWVLSSLLPLFIAIKALVDRYTISRVITVIAGAIYSVICTLTFTYFASRYQPPLADAFDLCVKDLYLVAGRMGATYEVVNIIFFVVMMQKVALFDLEFGREIYLSRPFFLAIFP